MCIFAVHHGSPSITTFVNRLNPSQVFVYVPLRHDGRVSSAWILARSRSTECTPVTTKGFLLSGELVTLSCTPRP